MKHIMHIILLCLIAFTWSSFKGELPLSNISEGETDECAVFISDEEEYPNREVGTSDVFPLSKEGIISCAPQIFSVASDAEEPQAKTLQRRQHLPFGKWAIYRLGLLKFRSTIHRATGGYTQDTSAPVSFHASHILYIYVLRHIIR